MTLTIWKVQKETVLKRAVSYSDPNVTSPFYQLQISNHNVVMNEKLQQFSSTIMKWVKWIVVHSVEITEIYSHSF